MGSGDHSALPANWEVRHSRTHNKEYYFNRATKESRWDQPTAQPKLGAWHILAKHQGSRRPSSWREETITRSKDDARAQIEGFLAELAQCESIDEKRRKFGDIAQQYSDCSSAKRRGDLGPFDYGAMQKPFEDAVVALQVNEISKPVETDSGIHIILRTQ
ncbi:peptidyl-prolyl cis-trans isomerase Pin1 [Coemansia sp. RSA 2704]|nr:peptidyl-prolyl cis-trans isomerase Pin1 [Coemansia sp. RSA 2704]